MSLVIRKSQLRAMQSPRDQEFVDKVGAYLREAFPEKTQGLTDELLQERIRDAMERSFTYGIETERDVCHFVDYTFRYSPAFDTGSVREILELRGVSASERLNAIGRQLRSGSKDRPLF